MAKNENEKLTRKRVMNPNSLANLRQFSSDQQPKKNGRPKGTPNRATVYEGILNLKTEIKKPDGTTKQVTLYEAIALGQAKSAMKGNTNAWREIQDSLHGKQPDKTETTGTLELNHRDLSKLSVDELLELKRLQSKIRD